MKIIRAKINDAEEILNLQKLAFQSQARIYNDDKLPPLIQELDEIKQEFREKIVLKAIINEQIIGSVRAYEDEGTCHIGRLIVHPDFQNQGIGKQLMLAVEDSFEDCARFELFTGYKSVKNIHLYEKLNYKTFKIGEEYSISRVKLYFMEKTRILTDHK